MVHRGGMTKQYRLFHDVPISVIMILIADKGFAKLPSAKSSK